MKEEKGTFAAGCFWGVEDEFRKIPGVTDVTAGYTGGRVAHPTYEKVCGEDTGHAEAVTVTFDPEKVSYEALVRAFFTMHDPTQYHRQGPDVGEQYRSAIFFHSDEQRAVGERVRDEVQASGVHTGEVVTEIQPASSFYDAEEYHQQYFAKGRGEVATG